MQHGAHRNDSGEPDVCANDLIYPAYGEDGGNGKWMPTIYLEKGKSIAVEYQLSPNNANKNLPLWQTSYTGVDAMKDALDLPADVDKSTVTPFTDVVSGSYYENAVLWAVENGITRGTEDGTTFSPELVCDRAQIVTFIYRCMK